MFCASDAKNRFNRKLLIMNYEEATAVKEQNGHLIGQTYRGATIEDILIRPTDAKEFDEWSKRYIRTMDGDAAIAPFLESNLAVDVVCDRAKIRTSNIFFRTEIENLLDEGLEVNL